MTETAYVFADSAYVDLNGVAVPAYSSFGHQRPTRFARPTSELLSLEVGETAVPRHYATIVANPGDPRNVGRGIKAARSLHSWWLYGGGLPRTHLPTGEPTTWHLMVVEYDLDDLIGVGAGGGPSYNGALPGILSLRQLLVVDEVADWLDVIDWGGTFAWDATD
jgi:hypothetical protein